MKEENKVYSCFKLLGLLTFCVISTKKILSYASSLLIFEVQNCIEGK